MRRAAAIVPSRQGEPLQFEHAGVVTMFLLTSSNERMRPKLEADLKPGTRIVSNQFPIKGWKPSQVVKAHDGKMEHTIYLYEVGRTK